jgi:hypothetical protein
MGLPIEFLLSFGGAARNCAIQLVFIAVKIFAPLRLHVRKPVSAGQDTRRWPDAPILTPAAAADDTLHPIALRFMTFLVANAAARVNVAVAADERPEAMGSASLTHPTVLLAGRSGRKRQEPVASII